MGRTTPWSYYRMFVEPNYQDYLQSPDDIRRAINASVPAFQLADVMFNYYSRHDRSKLTPWRKDKVRLLKDLSRREPFFFTVQSVANLYKHLYEKPNSTISYDMGSPGGLWSLRVPGTQLNSSCLTGGQADVIVRRRNGADVSLTKALSAVVNNLWPAVLPPEP